MYTSITMYMSTSMSLSMIYVYLSVYVIVYDLCLSLCLCHCIWSMSISMSMYRSMFMSIHDLLRQESFLCSARRYSTRLRRRGRLVTQQNTRFSSACWRSTMRKWETYWSTRTLEGVWEWGKTQRPDSMVSERSLKSLQSPAKGRVRWSSEQWLIHTTQRH